ncbi:uncharacterized protein BKCO1_5000056 [Diplodia corticola]|uniref:Uncharacterized protein n=1 Tax=Diplodia corticola TaxID=236234 RepID=A0A1J9QQS6_9PEZI|nr:uncharacterized protein BKCO1_5000056 [Diplodia corticola]OJD31286.1 hypothetical protein BKCO1_5000056 [Diplodia corticola]
MAKTVKKKEHDTDDRHTQDEGSKGRLRERFRKEKEKIKERILIKVRTIIKKEPQVKEDEDLPVKNEPDTIKKEPQVKEEVKVKEEPKAKEVQKPKAQPKTNVKPKTTEQPKIKEEPKSKEPKIKTEPSVEQEEPTTSATHTVEKHKPNKGKHRRRDDVLPVEDDDGNEHLLLPNNFADFERERDRLAAASTREIHNVWTLTEELGIADLMNLGYDNDAQALMTLYNRRWAGRRIGLLTPGSEPENDVWITLRRRELHEIEAMMEQLKEDRDAQFIADYGTEV